MNFKGDFYPESRFGGFSDIDGTLAFYLRVNALLTPGSTVVDFGCGRGAFGDDPIPFRRNMRNLRGKAARVIGLDVTDAAAKNPFIDEFFQLTDGCWPLPDCSADFCVSDNVLEHLPDPAVFFREAQRVIKPGGFLCIRTPNAWNYVALLARLIPNRAHSVVLDKVKDKNQEQDVFQTHYRCNNIPALRRMLTHHGFEPVVYGYEAEPSYLSFSKLAYALGVIHQRFAPSWLRTAIFAFGKKLNC